MLLKNVTTEMEEKDILSHIEDTNWDLTVLIKLLCKENHHPGPYRPAPPPPRQRTTQNTTNTHDVWPPSP